MLKHEFYADPTLFDHWQRSAGAWLGARAEKVRPFGWAGAFATGGVVLLAVSLVLLAISLGRATADSLPAWNISLAQGVTTVLALVSAQYLFCQALDAWPAGIPLPVRLRRVGRYLGWQPSVEARAAKVHVLHASRRSDRAAASKDERAAVRAFFAGVRTAGVNVTIAKALFAAGIRSPRQVLKASDRTLTAIHGVGPATVHKLRTQFGKRA